MTRRTQYIAIWTIALFAACVFAQTAPTTSTVPSDLKIVTQKQGRGAQVGDRVKVLYTGRLTDGKVFDTTADRGDEPLMITVGEGKVIKGWELGILGMQFGEKRTLIIPPELAWGAAGRGNVIPPNATVEFDIEVVGIEQPRE